MQYNFSLLKRIWETFSHISTCSYLSPEAKRANSKLRDPVVLEEHALRLIGHSDRDGGEVLRLAAHSHGSRVAHAQVRARRCRTWLTEDQPHHQPEGETAWRRAERWRGERVLKSAITINATTYWVQMGERLCTFCIACKLMYDYCRITAFIHFYFSWNDIYRILQ